MKQAATRQKVVIIGAGIGGLATANLLAQAGYQVDIYEQAAVPGGRVGLLKQDGFSFDTGPSWLLMRDVFQHYYQLLGTSLDTELDPVRLDPAYKLFFASTDPVTITSDIERDAETFEAIEPGAGQRLRRYVRRSAQTYNVALQHFLYTNFSRPANLLHPTIVKNSPALLRHAGRSLHRLVASQFHDQRLQQIMEYQTVFLGTSPYKAPAIYSLMSHLDFTEGVFYPRHGMYSLVTSQVNIGRKLGVTYHFSAPVEQVVSEGGRATGIRLKSREFVTADIVISNADLHFTETKLLATTDQSYPESYWQSKTVSPSALLLYIGVKGLLPEFEHHNLLFVDDWQQNFADIASGKMPEQASIYICKTTATDKNVAPKGDENIFVLVPIPAGVTLTKAAEQEYAARYLEQIKAMTGVDLAGRASQMTVRGPGYFDDQFNAWRSTMLGPAHTLTQSALLRTPNRSRKLQNLYYVGASTRPGIGLPMCLISAELIYKQLAGDKTAGPVKEIKEIGHA